MTNSFANSGSEDVYNGRNSAAARSLLPRDLWRVAFRKFDQLDSAAALDDLRVPPVNRLEALKADRARFYSIRINDQYRICFSWTESGAGEVEIADKH